MGTGFEITSAPARFPLFRRAFPSSVQSKSKKSCVFVCVGEKKHVFAKKMNENDKDNTKERITEAASRAGAISEQIVIDSSFSVISKRSASLSQACL